MPTPKWRAFYTLGPFYLLFLVVPWAVLCHRLNASPVLATLLALCMASTAGVVLAAFGADLMRRPMFSVQAPFVVGAAVAIPIFVRQSGVPTPVRSAAAIGVSVTLLSFLIGFYNPLRCFRFLRVAFFLVFIACTLYVVDEWFLAPSSAARSLTPRLSSGILLLVIGLPALRLAFLRGPRNAVEPENKKGPPEKDGP